MSKGIVPDAQTDKEEAVNEFKLGAVLPRDVVDPDYPQMWMKKHFKDNAAKDDKVSRDEDGALKLRMGDNVPKHFLDTVLGVRSSVGAPLPPGVCYSGADCV